MLTVRAALAVALFGLSVGALSQGPTPTPLETTGKPESKAGQTQEKSEPDKRATKDLPAIIEISKAPVIQIESADKTEKRRDYSSSEWWLVYITSALAIITLALAIYTAKLWASTERHAQIDLRAYVAVSVGSVSGVLGGQIPQAEIIVKNSGKTPAYRVATLGGIATGKSFDTLPVATFVGGHAKGTLALPLVDGSHITRQRLAP